MANQEHLKLLKQGRESWNEWRKWHSELHLDLIGADLNRADLSFADLNGADLSFADLIGAHLTDADLIGANLSYAHLRGANLGYAHLIGTNLSYAHLGFTNLMQADLSRADLSRADLSRANLTDANLSRANLSRANLSRAMIGWTTFGDVDLRTVQGLETVEHRGPSTIGTNTLVRSEGAIPEVFLRGAGLPDTFVTYARSLITSPIQYYTCFISHSSKDQRFCNRLYADLQAKGIRAWYFPEDATWGKSVWGEIDRSIKVYDKLVVVCSEHSLQSGPVQREIERALQREDREGKHILFPIRLDNYLFEVWEHERKADILSKVVGDFRGWDRNAAKYETAFTKFLKALNAQEEAS